MISIKTKIIFSKQIQTTIKKRISTSIPNAAYGKRIYFAKRKKQLIFKPFSISTFIFRYKPNKPI
ncbi:hypothetical protein B0A58_06500 [Flavobacterium branchiophilum NBRC 15030 = ATCC 35035]|nr:hypothetical protein B0A58_06500 [Flavobacterium branchiophilum NBRC 15030 = ATCC 35035]